MLLTAAPAELDGFWDAEAGQADFVAIHSNKQVIFEFISTYLSLGRT
ncbi:MAG: hypothetical protein LBF27_06400 [Sphingobacterium sp.]|nr:hypothetical protein [Sphingobacterium sp.]